MIKQGNCILVLPVRSLDVCLNIIMDSKLQRAEPKEHGISSMPKCSEAKKTPLIESEN